MSACAFKPRVGRSDFAIRASAPSRSAWKPNHHHDVRVAVLTLAADPKRAAEMESARVGHSPPCPRRPTPRRRYNYRRAPPSNRSSPNELRGPLANQPNRPSGELLPPVAWAIPPDPTFGGVNIMYSIPAQSTTVFYHLAGPIYAPNASVECSCPAPNAAQIWDIYMVSFDVNGQSDTIQSERDARPERRDGDDGGHVRPVQHDPLHGRKRHRGRVRWPPASRRGQHRVSADLQRHCGHLGRTDGRVHWQQWHL